MCRKPRFSSRTAPTAAAIFLATSLGASLGPAFVAAGCEAPTDPGVSFGLSEAAHDATYFPISANVEVSTELRGRCDDPKPCDALTGSHQCTPDDVANTFSRPFCKEDDAFQAAALAERGDIAGSYACAQCHGASGSLRVARCAECHLLLPIVPPGDPRDLDGALSPDERHRHVGGFAVDTPVCASCHAENFDTNRDGAFDRNDLSPANRDRVEGHRPFAITLGEAHHRVACADCHAAPRGDKPWALDFQAFTCRTCHTVDHVQAIHTDDGVSRVPGYDGPDEGACLDCHANGRTP